MDYLKKTFTVPGPQVDQEKWDRIFRRRVKTGPTSPSTPDPTGPSNSKRKTKSPKPSGS